MSKIRSVNVLAMLLCVVFAGTIMCACNNTIEDEEYINYQGLDFCLLDNDTYGVKIGNATELSTIIIPEKYLGKTVTVILAKGFAPVVGMGTRLTKIIIPKTVIKIEAEAFHGCGHLTTVEFAADSQLMTIEQRAFLGCYELCFITLPKSTKNIGERCFEATSWRYIVIPESVETIGAYAFGDEHFPYDMIMCETKSSLDGWNSLWYDGKEPYYYRSSVDITSETNYSGKYWAYQDRESSLINTWVYDSSENNWKVKAVFVLKNNSICSLLG